MTTVRRSKPNSCRVARSGDGQRSIEQPGKPSAARRVAVVLGLLSFACAVGVQNQPAQAANTVVIDVDGTRETIETHSTVVADVLDLAGVDVDPADAVVPALEATLDDGGLVTVTRARSVVLNVDGTTTMLEVPAVTVDDIVETLDVAEPGADVTSSRHGLLPADSTTHITVRNPVPVEVVADGVVQTVLIPPAPVDVILAAGDVEVGPDDLVEVTVASTSGQITSIDGAASVGAGGQVLVTRITTTTEQRDTPLTSPDEQRLVPTMAAGTTEVGQVGVPGVRHDTFEVTFHNGRRFSERVIASSEIPPTPTITLVGTATTSAATKNWAALAQCESNGIPTIVSASGKYHGLYQFAVSTWVAVGGVGLPSQASPEEQTLRAMILYDMNGPSPWPVCGKRL